MNQPPYGGPPGGYGPPGGGYGPPPGGGYGPPPGGYGPPGYGPPGGNFGGPPPFNPMGNGPPQTSTLAIVSLICGVLSFCLCCGILSFPAIICGFMARAETEKDPNIGGAGLALAGIILGFLAFGSTAIAFFGGFMNAIFHNLR